MYHQTGFRNTTMATDNTINSPANRHGSRFNGVVGLHRNNLGPRSAAAESASMKILNLARGGNTARAESNQRHLLSGGDQGQGLAYSSRSYSSSRATNARTEELSNLSHKSYRMPSGTQIGRKASNNNNSSFHVRRPLRQDSTQEREISEQSMEFDCGRNASMSRTRVQCFKTKMCHFYLQQKCSRGSNCVFAHSPDELRLTPDLSKTKLCMKWKKGLCFADSSKCGYAHGVEELRPSVNQSDSNESPCFSNDLADEDQTDQVDESAHIHSSMLSPQDFTSYQGGYNSVDSRQDSYRNPSYSARPPYLTMASPAYSTPYNTLPHSARMSEYPEPNMFMNENGRKRTASAHAQGNAIQPPSPSPQTSSSNYAQSMASMEHSSAEAPQASDFWPRRADESQPQQNSQDESPLSTESIEIQQTGVTSMATGSTVDETPGFNTPAASGGRRDADASSYKDNEFSGEKGLRSSNPEPHPTGEVKTRRLSTSPSDYVTAGSPRRDAEELSPKSPSSYYHPNENNHINNPGNYYYPNMYHPYPTNQSHPGFPQHNPLHHLSSSYNRQSCVPMLPISNNNDQSTESTPSSSRYGPPSFRKFFPPPLSQEHPNQAMRFSLPPNGHGTQISPLAPSPSPSQVGRPSMPQMPSSLSGPVMVQVPQPSSPSSPGCPPTPSHYILHNGYLVPLVFASSPLQPPSPQQPQSTVPP